LAHEQFKSLLKAASSDESLKKAILEASSPEDLIAITEKAYFDMAGKTELSDDELAPISGGASNLEELLGTVTVDPKTNELRVDGYSLEDLLNNKNPSFKVTP
jgi:predicted ribosomally synthesized peptide with nif11-like leader